MIAPRYSATDRRTGGDPSSHVLLSHVSPGVRCRGEFCTLDADAAIDGEPLCRGHLEIDHGIDLAEVDDEASFRAEQDAVADRQDRADREREAAEDAEMFRRAV